MIRPGHGKQEKMKKIELRRSFEFDIFVNGFKFDIE